MNNSKIKDIPKELRPYEKCLKFGPQVLSDEELLAVILKTGTKGENVISVAQNLLSVSGNYEGVLALNHHTLSSLKSVKGIGEAKAVSVICICEISRRIAKAEAGKRADFSSPEKTADYLMEEMRHLEVEKVKLLMLDNKNHLLADKFISSGTINSSPFSIREIIREALVNNAVNIIVAHNHPSGDPAPSVNDRAVTKRLKCAAELVGINMLDHIIIGEKQYYSFMENA